MENLWGLQITVRSVTEAVKYLLGIWMCFILTERFNQEYFGTHRSIGRRNDNPDWCSFGCKSNTIRMQISIVPLPARIKGRQKQKRSVSLVSVDNAPLPKRYQNK